jgi:hypothetical protein
MAVVKIIKKLHKEYVDDLEQALSDIIYDLLGDDKEILKIDDELYHADGEYDGWQHIIEMISKDDKKELGHLLTMFANRAKQRVLAKLRKPILLER